MWALAPVCRVFPSLLSSRERPLCAVDSNGKKTRFLSEVKRALALSNINVETVRVESWRPGRHFDAVVTRAFADLGTTLERVDHLMGSQGMLFAMKTESASKEVADMPPNTEHVASWDISVPGRDWPFQLLAIKRLRGDKREDYSCRQSERRRRKNHDER